MPIRLISLAITLIVVLALAPAAVAAPTTFMVDSTGAGSDVAPGDGDCATSGAGAVCTLRAAIEESNATGGGLPYTITFGVSQISVTSGGLPPITQDDVFIDGCGVGRSDFPSTDAGPPNEPVAGNCSGLIGTGAAVGLQVGDAGSDPSDVAIYNLAITNFTSAGVRIWGADRTRIAGNLLGRRINGTNEGNGAAVRVTGRTQNGTVVNRAIANIIGGPSNATDGTCDAYCNRILNSTVAGIDLVGTASGSGQADTPAGGTGGADEGTTIAGNWIGVHNSAGAIAKNAVAAKLGDSLETSFGTGQTDRGNVIAGNTKGIDQGSGTTSVTLLDGNLFGISPDRNTSVPNGSWNARLGGSDTPGGGAFIQNVTFGPTDVGLELTGPRANLIGSIFQSPEPETATFGTAAVHVGPGADSAYIGSNIAASNFGCIPLFDACNLITDTAPGAPGIWVDGANDARIWRNSIGGGIADVIPGPPIRISGDAVGADIGDNDDDPDRRNNLGRVDGPAIEVGGAATKIVIGDNDGLSKSTLGPPSGLFTDLLPAAGPGNSGAVNNGIQPPAITVSSTVGVGGTGIPGATVHVLLQTRGSNSDPPFEDIEEATPTTPSTATVGGDGIWGFEFPAPLTGSFKLLASQTTAADGTSEYSEPLAATAANTPPVVTFQSGPSGVVDTRSATFTFSSKPATRFTCSVDGGAFVPCTSPFTLNGLDIGGHQLQVKGTDPTGKVGAPASRTWIIQLAEPAASPPAAAARKVRFASVVTLPSARACISKRTLRIAVRAPKGAKLKSAEVRIGGRKLKTVRKAGTVPVSLKGLPRGRFVVRVKVTLTDGRTATGSRTYRTCAKKTRKTRKR